MGSLHFVSREWKMEVLESQIDVDDQKFQENAAYNRRLAEELRAHLKTARQGGGAKYQQRQREQGKLFVRDRIDQLLDAGSPFLELSPLAAFEMYGSEAPSAGIVTGIGRYHSITLASWWGDFTRQAVSLKTARRQPVSFHGAPVGRRDFGSR